MADDLDADDTAPHTRPQNPRLAKEWDAINHEIDSRIKAHAAFFECDRTDVDRLVELLKADRRMLELVVRARAIEILDAEVQAGRLEENPNMLGYWRYPTKQ